jgi:hypothetical protein
MAIIIPFNPTPTALFQFSPVLDGVTYIATTTWNIYSQRYYLNVYTVNQVLEFSIPLIASPDTGNINLAAGYFDTPIVFRGSSNNFEIG